MHQSVCTVSVFVPRAVIVTNPGNSLPPCHSLSLGRHGTVSDKPVLWPWGWAADRCAALPCLKRRFCFAPIWSVRLLLPAKAQTCPLLSRDADGERVLSPAAAAGGDPAVPAKPLKIHAGHRET